MGFKYGDIWPGQGSHGRFHKRSDIDTLSVEEFTEAVGKVCQQRGPQVRQEGTKHAKGSKK